MLALLTPEATPMPVKTLMSWEGHPHYRWVKMYRGVRYRVRAAELPGVMLFTEEGSRRAANEWWEMKRALLDGPPPDRAVIIEELEQTPALRAIMGRGDAARRIVSALDGVGRRASAEEIEAAVRRVLGGDVPDTTAQERAGMLREVQAEALGGAVPQDRTLGAVAAMFLSSVEMKPVSFMELRNELRRLVGELGESTDVGTITPAVVDQVFASIRGKPWSSATKNKRLGFFDRFVVWVAKRELCRMPQNLGQRLKNSKKKIKTYTVEQVRQFLNGLNPRFRLYALCGLNFGMTNADIGRMTKDMVDLDNSTLTRKRGKTEDNEDVPTVTYAIWSETLALLREFWSGHETYVLTSSSGTPLYSSSFGEGEDTKFKDLLLKQWRGQHGRERRPLIPLKAFRSISATMLESHPVYGRYVSHFLGHSPRSIKDKHYAAPSQSLFDEALDWLREKILGAN